MTPAANQWIQRVCEEVRPLKPDAPQRVTHSPSYWSARVPVLRLPAPRRAALGARLEILWVGPSGEGSRTSTPTSNLV
jgi:hypothetical protein